MKRIYSIRNRVWIMGVNGRRCWDALFWVINTFKSHPWPLCKEQMGTRKYSQTYFKHTVRSQQTLFSTNGAASAVRVVYGYVPCSLSWKWADYSSEVLGSRCSARDARG
ncbi:hypothetical protein PoB_001251500 [Plakobranchus ocellatus]|uniref:Uncharacterized protein n=1 Tax=Plakobranchus ocellatus TaxID=259542 RepID=A0AAV3YTA0_9GAST|nr:hypothetical protein PoB_001251500 [Plakobranchus ocellatus]